MKKKALEQDMTDEQGLQQAAAIQKRLDSLEKDIQSLRQEYGDTLGPEEEAFLQDMEKERQKMLEGLKALGLPVTQQPKGANTMKAMPKKIKHKGHIYVQATEKKTAASKLRVFAFDVQKDSKMAKAWTKLQFSQGLKVYRDVREPRQFLLFATDATTVDEATDLIKLRFRRFFNSKPPELVEITSITMLTPKPLPVSGPPVVTPGRPLTVPPQRGTMTAVGAAKEKKTEKKLVKVPICPACGAKKGQEHKPNCKLT